MSSRAANLLPYAGKSTADDLSAALGISKRELAETTGLPPGNLNRKARANSAQTRNRLQETTEILHRVTPWAGSIRQAFAWYRAEPLPEFGGRTAQSLVKSGKAAAVRDYLDHVALGGFS